MNPGSALSLTPAWTSDPLIFPQSSTISNTFKWFIWILHRFYRSNFSLSVWVGDEISLYINDFTLLLWFSHVVDKPGNFRHDLELHSKAGRGTQVCRCSDTGTTVWSTLISGVAPLQIMRLYLCRGRKSSGSSRIGSEESGWTMSRKQYPSGCPWWDMYVQKISGSSPTLQQLIILFYSNNGVWWTCSDIFCENSRRR